MIALRLRWSGVIRAELSMDYLLEDEGECFTDLRFELGREAKPDVVGLGGHSTSHCVASATNSSTACAVSLVRGAGRDRVRLVAVSEMRKSIPWRYITTTWPRACEGEDREATANRRPKRG